MHVITCHSWGHGIKQTHRHLKTHTKLSVRLHYTPASDYIIHLRASHAKPITQFKSQTPRRATESSSTSFICVCVCSFLFVSLFVCEESHIIACGHRHFFWQNSRYTRCSVFVWRRGTVAVVVAVFTVVLYEHLTAWLHSNPTLAGIAHALTARTKLHMLARARVRSPVYAMCVCVVHIYLLRKLTYYTCSGTMATPARARVRSGTLRNRDRRSSAPTKRPVLIHVHTSASAATRYLLTPRYLNTLRTDNTSTTNYTHIFVVPEWTRMLVGQSP